MMLLPLYAIVGYYSMKHLSIKLDKLLTLAGLATHFASPRLGKCLEVVWYSQLPNVFTWEIQNPQTSYEYRGPSWSLTSPDGDDLGMGRAHRTLGLDYAEVVKVD